MMHGSTSFSGYVAKCASLYGCVAMIQTVRALRLLSGITPRGMLSVKSGFCLADPPTLL